MRASLLFLFPLVLLILVYVAVIWMFVDMLKNPRISPEMKLVWALAFFLGHFITALIYYFLTRHTVN